MQREVLVLLRLVDNRLCADCDTPLSGNFPVSASCDFGTWICEKCTGAHKALNLPNIKLASSNWSDEEVNV